MTAVPANSPTKKAVVEVLRGQVTSRPPIWFMRQAGRYLPEYRALRQRAGSFLNLCYTPELAAEATLQPIKRFDLDAAILFSDILVVPDALGQPVEFVEGEGPRLAPLTRERLAYLDVETIEHRLAPMYETLRHVRRALAPDKALIGFCGGPWTVATYMIGGQGSADQAAARLFALTEPAAFARLLEILVEASAAYLIGQLRAGADAVQIFESWAANLDAAQFETYVVAPARTIVSRVRAEIPQAAIVGFPRAAGIMATDYAARTGIDALALDQAWPVAAADRAFPRTLPLQGNLDPLRLLAGGAQLDAAIDAIVAGFAERPHIFNLGHGVLPETPIAHIEAMVARVRG